MDINSAYWEENSNIQHLKYESCNSNDGELPRLKDEPLYRCCDSNLNFATVACSEDDSEYSQYKKNKISRQDPMSHRIIEKRRRDRMNNCLADLSRLIPAEYLKKGRGRIEKTEIIEMAIRHIKYLQQSHKSNGKEQPDRSHVQEQFRLGYQECMSETMRFLVEVEGYFAREALCIRLINHLQKYCENLFLRERGNTGPKITIDDDFAQLPQIPTNSLTNGLNNSTLQSPKRPHAEHYENGSQLRDMLTACTVTIKDESRINSHQILRPVGSSNLTQLPIPEHDRRCNDEYKQQQLAPEDDYLKSNNRGKERVRKISENDSYSNGSSLYKFKNNIKQRFSQDVSAETSQTDNNNKMCKRRKVVDLRRNSITAETYSSENHSSPIDGSQYSPPSSELYRLSSESETARISPTGSSVSDNRLTNRYVQLKPENTIQKSGNPYERFVPITKSSSTVDPHHEMGKNFNVPIFALHAKGSFYIPLTIDYQTLVPFLQHHNISDMLPNVHNIILHPVTINVNFQSNYFASNSTVAKSNKHKVDGQNGWH